MNKYVNKKLLLHKILKSSKQDEIVYPAGMCSEEGRHRGNDFCFKEDKRNKTKKKQKKTIDVARQRDCFVQSVEKSKSIDTLMGALEKQATALKQRYIKYIKRRVMCQGR